MDSIFLNVSVLLGIATAVALLLRMIKQPLIISYILAGIIAGPVLLNLLDGDIHMYEAFAQFGVVLLLFGIGLSLNLTHLRKIGKVSLITGLGQVLFTASVGLGMLLFLGVPIVEAAFLAVAITFSSTIIILKLLGDKGHVDTTYGRYTIGLMLVQDVIAVGITIALGLLTQDASGGFIVYALFAAKLILAGFLLYLLSIAVLPWVLHQIARSSELLFLFAAAWCFLVASGALVLGLSLEIGAIAAGMSLAASPFQLEIASRIRPLRDFFLVIFFIVLGNELVLGSLGDIALVGTVLSAFILIGNPLILYILFRSQKFTKRNSFLAGLTAAQVSEFGFVLLFAGRQAGYVGSDTVAIFTYVAIVTIFVSSYLIIYSERIFDFLYPLLSRIGKDAPAQKEHTEKAPDAWVVGYHRVGVLAARTLRDAGLDVSVIEHDPWKLSEIREHGLTERFGDIADAEFLAELPMSTSKLLLMTIPGIEAQLHFIHHVRQRGSHARIIANAYHKGDAQVLYNAGADLVIMPHHVGASWVARIVQNGVPEDERLSELRDEQGRLLAL